jgi:hypothetical protein
MAELRWAQEVYTGSGRTSLLQSRCSCYPLSVDFTVGLQTGARGRGLPSLCGVCVAVVCWRTKKFRERPPPRRVPRPPFYRSREEPWGTWQKEEARKEKKEREKAEKEALTVVPLSLSATEARWPNRRGRGRPPRRHSTVTVAVVV